MDAKLRVAWWALLGSLDELGDDYAPGPELASMLMVAKRQVVTESIAVVDLAMDVLGDAASGGRRWARLPGRAGGNVPPFTPEMTLAYAGKLALGDLVRPSERAGYRAR